MTFDAAVEIFREEYEKALTMPHVLYPLAHGMHRAWQRVDKAVKKEKKHEGKD